MRRCAGYVGYEEGGHLTETVRRKPYKLRPEFVNRIDEIVAFHSLDEKNIRSIAKIQMRYLEGHFAAKDNISAEWQRGAIRLRPPCISRG